MKIPASVRAIYDEISDDYGRLKDNVDRLLAARKDPRWHYESRIKEPISFALKLETGRVPIAREMEDFFACTLVVENRHAISKAENLIGSLFQIEARRPRSKRKTNKNPDSFRFDDLRLYVKLAPDPSLPPSPAIDKLLFEVQIKTFLQHAWSIATHELVYKGQEASWPKSRIAYQVKAMLEHAETSIEMIQLPEVVTLLDISDTRSTRLQKIIHGLSKRWEPEELPTDTVRLADTLDNLAQGLGWPIDRLWVSVDLETQSGRGAKTLNLSPYGSIVQSLLHTDTKAILSFLKKSKSRRHRFCLFVPHEIDLPRKINVSINQLSITGTS